MKSRKAVCAILSATMLMSMCTFGASAVIGDEVDTLTIGDVNRDKIININDATILQKFLVGDDVGFAGMPKSIFDLNEDNSVNINDVTMIQMYLAMYSVDSNIGKPYNYEATTNPEPVWHEAVYKTVNHPAETKTVNHPAETKKVWVEPVTHEEPVYTTSSRCICNDCGADITDMSADDMTKHMVDHLDAGGYGSYKNTLIKVQSGTKTVVDKEGYYKTVTVKEAWTETVVVKEAWTERVLVKEAGWY